MFLNNMDFGFGESGNSPSSLNRKGWIPLAVAAVGAAATAYAASKSGSAGSGADGKVRDQTSSGQGSSDMTMLYGEGAQEAIDDYTAQIGEWTEENADYASTYMANRSTIMDTNATMLPAIEKTAGDALEQISKDMVSNEGLKNSFKSAIEAGNTNLANTMNAFNKQLDNAPSEEERMGQAFAQIEGQFGRAGQELARRMAETGRNVSSADARNLAIEKAKAKSGAAGVAREGARNEKLANLQAGVTTQAGVTAGQSNQLSQISQTDTANKELAMGATNLQVGGVTGPDSELANIQAGLVTSEANKTLGTSTVTDDITHIQKGIKGAIDLDENNQVTQAQKDADADALAKKRAHELAMKRAGQQRRGTSYANGGGGPGVGGAEGAGGMSGAIGNGTGASSGSGGSADASPGDGAPGAL